MENFRDLKKNHPDLIMALQADAKSFPGGIKKVADILDVSASTLGNNLNVNHDSPVPSFAVVVETMKLVSPNTRGLRALASMLGLSVTGVELGNQDAKDIMKEFVELVHDASAAINKGSVSMMDGDFSRAEMREIEPILLSLIKSASEVLTVINSHR